ncbi:acyl-CoA-binding domain-containing protein 5 [Neodiprion virginianus]|uniref:acyl-CoA-binding domain-containing protein 5 n=1 Tax=Neodiprion virginianus TaxID=2961670 RepID=UPI001EE76025|nr:acyl-CoA-binding domain-containing protein 5 [Neodiprion virginianus]
MTTEEKFHAAVNVIRNLPKNGAYQPSNELMLRFYSYYKQATEGPCQQPKPGFWEVVRKAKWDAWMRLGNMGRVEAMNNYVDELKKIVETMSYTDNVANFLGSLDSFYDSVPAEDLEMLVGPVLERMRSQPGSPLSGSPIGSRETSPHRARGTSRHITSSLETSPASSHSASPLPPDTDGEEEVFIDTVESAPERTANKDSTSAKYSSNHHQKQSSTTAISNSKNSNKITNGQLTIVRENSTEQLKRDSSPPSGHAQSNEEVKPERGRSRERKDDKKNAEFFAQITATVQNLQRDLDRITARVRSLEGHALNTLSPQLSRAAERRYPKWWPLPECSPRLFALMILWPFLVHAAITIAQRNRQRNV